MSRNFLGEVDETTGSMFFAEAQPGDVLQYGIRGMKWGVRRTDKQIANDTASRKASGEEVTPTAKAAAVKAPESSGSESAQARYARLTEQAKASGASSLSDDDLRFVNSRTEALNKVSKMTSSNPSWLKETSTKVLKKTAEKTMQEISNSVARKYITVPITDAIGAAQKAKDKSDDKDDD